VEKLNHIPNKLLNFGLNFGRQLILYN